MKIMTVFLVFVALLVGCAHNTPERVSTLISPSPPVLPTVMVPEPMVIAPAKPIPWEPKQVFRVEAFDLIMYDPREFAVVASNYFVVPVLGFAQMDKRVIHVPWNPYVRDINGNRIPEWPIFGHEGGHLIWGMWHAQDPKILRTNQPVLGTLAEE